MVSGWNYIRGSYHLSCLYCRFTVTIIFSIQFQLLLPYWLHSWRLFGSLSGPLLGSLLGSLPPTVLCGNIRKQRGLALLGPPKRADFGALFGSIEIPFWAPFGCPSGRPCPPERKIEKNILIRIINILVKTVDGYQPKNKN